MAKIFLLQINTQDDDCSVLLNLLSFEVFSDYNEI